MSLMVTVADVIVGDPTTVGGEQRERQVDADKSRAKRRFIFHSLSSDRYACIAVRLCIALC